MKKIISSTLAIIMILLVMVPCSTAFAVDTYKVTYQAQFGQTEARKSLAMVNDFRTGSDAWYWNSTNTKKLTAAGLSKLTYDYELEKGAMQRAAEIAVMYSHSRPDGSNCFTAYSWTGSCGENIAAGYSTVEKVIEGWMETDEPYSGQGHRRNMLNSSFNGYAIGHVVYKGVHYWVQEFVGTPSSSLTSLPLDETKAMTINVSSDKIKNVTLLSSTASVSLETGENAALPSVTANLTTNDFWSYSTDSIAVTPQGTFTVADTSVAKIQDGKLCALKAGTTTLTYSAMGKTVKISVTVTNPICKHTSTRTVTETVLKATCTTDGSFESVLYCMDCEEELSRTKKTIPATGHTWGEAEELAEGNCVSDQIDEYTCLVCGAKKTERTPAKGHSWDIEFSRISKAATCTTEGERVYTCTSCEVVEKTEVIPALGHDMEIDLDASPAECLDAGNTESSHCTRCGYTVEAKTIPAIGHTWGEAEELAEGNCVSDQIDEYTCLVCGAKKTERTPAKGHSWDIEFSRISKAATCTTKGERVYTCVSCEVVEKTEVIPAKGHSFNKTKTTKATFSANGKDYKICDDCGIAGPTVKVYYKVNTPTLSKTYFTYSGKAQKPTVTVKDSKGNTLKNGTDYSIKYANSGSAAVGTYTVTVTLKGKYSGTKTLTYKIEPQQVTGLKAGTVKTNSIALSWTKVTGAKYYKVEKYNSSTKKYGLVKIVSTNSITVSSLNPGTRYKFRVTALDSTKKLNGQASTPLTVGTLCSAPTIQLTSTKSKTATVTITKVTGAKKYIIYKSTDGKNWTKVSTTSTSYTISKLTGGKRIYVKVQAVNADGKASASSSAKYVVVKK